MTKQVNISTESQAEDAKQKRQQIFDNINFDRQSTIAEIIWTLKIVLTLFKMGWGGGAKRPPASFSPVTSSNVGIIPQNLLTFSFNAFAALV